MAKNKEPTLEEAWNAIVKGLGILVDYPNKVVQEYLLDDEIEDGNRDKPKKEKKKPKKKKL